VCALGVHDTFRDALTILVSEFFQQVKVLHQNRTEQPRSLANLYQFEKGVWIDAGEKQC
jgi:hypothetical protein